MKLENKEDRNIERRKKKKKKGRNLKEGRKKNEK